MSRKTTHVQVDGKDLVLSNLDKVLYPESGFTKAQVIDYYLRIAPLLLPHLKDRPLTLKRYPEGVHEEFFYEKRCPSFRPKWVSVVNVSSNRKNDTINYCTVSDVASLVWVANLASIELHTLLSRYPRTERPTMLVFDLDPGEGASLLDSCRIAQRLRKLLEGHGLQSLPKASGGKGLHLYVPLNTPVTHEQTKGFARHVANSMASQWPDEVTSNMLKKLRVGKVFIDWSQNDEHKTTVCVYSLRARTAPTVSMPVTWAEVGTALRKKDPSTLVFQADAALARADRKGDLFEPVLTLRQKLPAIDEREAA